MVINMISNFLFFYGKWDVFVNLGEIVERNVYYDLYIILMKFCLFGEILMKFILVFENI